MLELKGNYKDLYQNKLKHVEWYKRPNTRLLIRVSAISVIFAGIIISSITIHALNYPTATIGTVGHNLLGYQGLCFCAGLSWVAAIAVDVALRKYKEKSKVMLSDYIEKDNGFVYEIKDSNSVVKGYLCGTMARMGCSWKGLNPDLMETLEKCGEVLVSPAQIPTDRPSMPCDIMRLAKEKGIKITELESDKEYSKLAKSFQTKKRASKWITRKFSPKNILCSSREAADRHLIAWQMGNEKAYSDIRLIFDGVVLNGISDAPTTIFEKLTKKSSDNWLKVINDKLKSDSEKPFLIAVDSIHLFDFDSCNVTGLKTLLRRRGWILSKISKEDSEIDISLS